MCLDRDSPEIPRHSGLTIIFNQKNEKSKLQVRQKKIYCCHLYLYYCLTNVIFVKFQEEINTKQLAQQISAELKRYSIPQSVFAQKVLCRSQGTLSDLLRNPKPWSKLKSGRDTFRRMWKWLQEPEASRITTLRLACVDSLEKMKEEGFPKQSAPEAAKPKKPRLVFTDLQRRTLQVTRGTSPATRTFQEQSIVLSW